MPRYIDADALWMDIIHNMDYCDDVLEYIEAQPTADVVERKKGKWITDKYGNVVCSECGWCAPQIMTGCIANRHLDYDKSDFCWHCGSDNREENDNE